MRAYARHRSANKEAHVTGWAHTVDFRSDRFADVGRGTYKMPRLILLDALPESGRRDEGP